MNVRHGIVVLAVLGIPVCTWALFGSITLQQASQTPAVTAKIQRIMDHQRVDQLPLPPTLPSQLTDAQPLVQPVAPMIPSVVTGETWVLVLRSGFIRSGPSARYPVIRTAKPGETLKLLERNPWWVRVEDGWIYGEFIRTKE